MNIKATAKKTNEKVDLCQSMQHNVSKYATNVSKYATKRVNVCNRFKICNRVKVYNRVKGSHD